MDLIPFKRKNGIVSDDPRAENKPILLADGRSRLNPVDVYVGSRICQRRLLLGLSQGQLAGILGVSFQQVQKYENGTNRVTASRLFCLSKELNVTIGFFFAESSIGLGEFQNSHSDREGLCESFDQLEAGTLSHLETLRLVQAFSRITDTSVRVRVFELLKSLSSDLDAPTPLAS